MSQHSTDVDKGYYCARRRDELVISPAVNPCSYQADNVPVLRIRVSKRHGLSRDRYDPDHIKSQRRSSHVAVRLQESSREQLRNSNSYLLIKSLEKSNLFLFFHIVIYSFHLLAHISVAVTPIGSKFITLLDSINKIRMSIVNLFTDPTECSMFPSGCNSLIGVWGPSMTGQCLSNEYGFHIGASGYRYAVIQVS